MACFPPIKGVLGGLNLWQFMGEFRAGMSKTQNDEAEYRPTNRALRGVLRVWPEKLYVQRCLLAIRA